MQETQVRSLGREDLLEKEMATHSSILAWKIPRMEEPGRLQSMGSQRVRQDWATSLHYENVYQMGSKWNSKCEIISLVTQRVKNLPAMREAWVWSLGREDLMEGEMATHSCILAWEIPWREEPDGLSPCGLKESYMNEWLTLSHKLVETISAYLYIRAKVISKHKSNKTNYEQKLISFEYPAVNFSFTWTFDYLEIFVYILRLYCLNTLSSRYQNLTFTLVKSIYQLLLKSPIINNLIVTSGKYHNPLLI